MINYYDELHIVRNQSLKQIQNEIANQQISWKHRLPRMPKEAGKALTLLNEAAQVFSTEESRAQYDHALLISPKTPIAVPQSKAAQDPVEREKLFVHWYQTAEKHFDSMQYDLAKTAIEKALTYLEPGKDHESFDSLAADIYRMNRNYPTALEHINRAILANSSSPNPYHYILKAEILRSCSLEQINNPYEQNSLIQKARNSVNEAIIIAKTKKDQAAEASAYAMLALCYYFVSSPDDEKAESYAAKAIDMGDPTGNAQTVMDAIKKTETSPEIHSETERANQNDAVQVDDREDIPVIKEKEHGSPSRQFLNLLNVIYKLTWFAALSLPVYVAYRIISCYNSRLYFDPEPYSTYLLIIFGIWVFLEKCTEKRSSAPWKISVILYVAFLIASGTMEYLRWGFGAAQATAVWQYVGIHLVIMIVVILGCRFMGWLLSKALFKGSEGRDS